MHGKKAAFVEQNKLIFYSKLYFCFIIIDLSFFLVLKYDSKRYPSVTNVQKKKSSTEKKKTPQNPQQTNFIKPQNKHTESSNMTSP